MSLAIARIEVRVAVTSGHQTIQVVGVAAEPVLLMKIGTITAITNMLEEK